MAVDFPELAAIRLGYGLSPAHAPPADLDAVMASIPRAMAMPDPVTTDRFRAEFAHWQAIRHASARAGGARGDAFRRARQAFSTHPDRDLARRLGRAVAEPVGYGERLVQFWADHFTVRAKALPHSQLVSAFVDEAIRPHLGGHFRDMLAAAVTHPAMLLYLDQVASAGPNSRQARRNPGRAVGLNENLAREVIELHTMGPAGGYGQDDVRQLAELLTGLTFAPGDPRGFRPEMAEPGAERFLGRSYGGRGTDGLTEIGRALADLAQRPATALHLSRKLIVHFLTDAPSLAAVDRIASVWRDTGGHLPAVHRALAAHPGLAATFRHKARQPFDFIAAALRALGTDPARLPAMPLQAARRDIVYPMMRMGQPWQRPVGPDGWPEAAASWVTPQGLAARIEWALDAPGRLADPLPDPRDVLRAALGSTASPALSATVPRAESTAEGVALVLASADFNRR